VCMRARSSCASTCASLPAAATLPTRIFARTPGAVSRELTSAPSGLFGSCGHHSRHHRAVVGDHDGLRRVDVLAKSSDCALLLGLTLQLD
jgi:hypothetical protein